MVVTSTNNYFSYGITCAECNHRLIAPNWSEYVSEHHIRHFWSCESCGHQFETADHLRFNAPSKAGWKVPAPSLLVA
jgi:uncharacterized protein with PIN domain